MQRPITVLHIFSGDLWAGAEVMVFNLLNRLKEFPELKIFALSLNNGILANKLGRENIDITIISEQQNSFPAVFSRRQVYSRSKE